MRRDFKSRDGFSRTRGIRGTSRYGLITLFIIVLCGSAITISLQTDFSTTKAEQALSNIVEVDLSGPATSAGVVTKKQPEAPAPTLKQMPLLLPQKNSPIKKESGAVTAKASITPAPLTHIEVPVQKTLQLEETAPQTIDTPSLVAESTATIEASENSRADAVQKEPKVTALPSTANNPLPSIPTSKTIDHAEATTPEPILAAIAKPDTDSWVETKVKNGDSLALIFNRLKLSPNLLHRIVHSSKEAKQLANIRPGELIRVRQNLAGDFLELVHQKSAIRSMRVFAENEQFTTKIIRRDLKTKIAEASGIIASSLFVDAQRAGLPESLIMELANIFGWDIDFALEIRAGDHFSLIYEEEFLDGKKFRNGNILAAEFINRGKVFRAIRYEHDDGFGSYYSPDGGSMRKAFLRAPVDFRRISSRFTKARFHPVLGRKRPHKGVDYSARTGTPIKAAGDGRVIYRARKGGYGRAIIIQHGQRYTTLYAHLSKYRGRVKNGSRVKQGQVIGYVGQSGLATGPHLHYEFRVNGVHRNPLTVKLPAAEPIAKKYRSDFKRKSSALLSQLDSISSTLVAEAETEQ